MFICLTLAFVGATEWLIRTRVIPNHNFYKYLSLFQTTAETSAIFGDSEVSYGFTGYPGFVNMAYPGDDFVNVDTKVRLFFANRKPDKVILQAGLHHFSKQYLWRVGRDDAFRDLLRDGAPPSFLEILNPIHRPEISRYWKVFLGKGKFIPRHLFQPDGSRLVIDRYTDYPQEFRRMAANRVASQIAPVDGLEQFYVADIYRELVDFLLEKGARMCLVTMPVAAEITEVTDSMEEFARAVAFFQRLAREKGIRYVSYWHNNLDDTFFADIQHLNAQGARVVTREIVNRCFPPADPS